MRPQALGWQRLRAAAGACLLAIASLAWPPVQAQADAARAAERSALAASQAALRAVAAEQEAQCLQRFVVTACVDAVRRQRREALAPLLQRDRDLADQQRQSAAADRALARKALLERRQAAAPAGPEPEFAQTALTAAPAASAASAASAAALSPQPSAPTMAAPGDRRADAARGRAEQSRQRAATIDARGARVKARLAARAQPAAASALSAAVSGSAPMP